MSRPIDASYYRGLTTVELQRRYNRLWADTSPQTAEEEVGRQFAMQEITTVLVERGAL